MGAKTTFPSRPTVTGFSPSARAPAPPQSPFHRRVRVLPQSFWNRPADVVARDLIGCHLIRVFEDGRRAGLRLVESEAYLGAPDRASHAFDGRRTRRIESLYLPPGHVYVYFVYGAHYCLNVVTGPAGSGAAVLIRAGEPIEGRDLMAARRGLDPADSNVPPADIAGGPGKLCQALDIDRDLDGLPLGAGPLRILQGPEPVLDNDIITGPRVGIDYAGEAASWPLRFALRDNPAVSRPLPGQPLASPSTPSRTSRRAPRPR